ncbi:hypothetical protein ACN28S_29870 [Cystobacter fuscus]
MPTLTSLTYKITMACGHTAERTWAASTQKTHAEKIRNLESEDCWACRQGSMQSDASMAFCQAQEDLFLKMIGQPLPVIHGVSEKQLVYARLLRARAFESIVKVFQSPWAQDFEAVQGGIINHGVIQEMLVIDDPASVIELCQGMPSDISKMLEDLRKKYAKRQVTSSLKPVEVEVVPNIFGEAAQA